MRKIAVFTGTRAEYDLLRPIIHGPASSKKCRVLLLVSGAHLSRSHGYTLDYIKADGLSPDALIPLPLEDGSPQGICSALGVAVSGMGRELSRLKPDLLVLLGDRYETLGAACAAQIIGVPVAHLHGGEITQGANDDAFRHAVTKMSHLHFTSCEAYRQRVIQLGEDPNRVFNVGSLGVENIHKLKLLDEAEIRRELGFTAGTPYMVCTFHPVTLEGGTEIAQLEELLRALEAFPDYAVVFTGANADVGGASINDALQSYTEQYPQHRFFMSLGQVRYFSAVKYASCVIGNSSSGIIEVPSLKVPVLNVGNRQKGRVAAAGVLHCGAEVRSVIETLAFALSENYKIKVAATGNPYDRPDTAKNIVHRITTWPLQGILRKSFYPSSPA